MQFVRSLVFSLVLLSLAMAAVSAPVDRPLVKFDPDAGIAYTNPVWSPDGRSIAYVSAPYVESPNEPAIGKTGKSIHLATRAGTAWKHRLLAKEADWPVWSPDGKQLAFRHNGLAVMTIATGSIKQITTDKEPGTEPDWKINYPLSWSPNGRYLLYQVTTPEISKAVVFDTKLGKTLSFAVGTEAAWLSTGGLLSINTAGPSDENAQGKQLILTDLTTGSSRTVLKDACVLRPFVPKGSNQAWFWLAHGAPKGMGIYGVDLKTGAMPKKVAAGMQSVYWSPNGKSFAFPAKWAERSTDTPQINLYVGDTTTWAFKAVARKTAFGSDDWHDRMKYADWSPDSKSIAYVTADGNINIIELN